MYPWIYQFRTLMLLCSYVLTLFSPNYRINPQGPFSHLSLPYQVPAKLIKPWKDPHLQQERVPSLRLPTLPSSITNSPTDRKSKLTLVSLHLNHPVLIRKFPKTKRNRIINDDDDYYSTYLLYGNLFVTENLGNKKKEIK